MDHQSDDKKSYGLKPIELQMLQAMHQQYNQTVSNFLSFIAIERLAYQMTPQTAFNVDFEKGTVELWEREPKEGDGAVPENAPAPETKKAKKLR